MTVRKTKDTMTPSLKRLNRQVSDIVDEAYKYFVKVTPRRSGNARRRTLLKRNKIELRYPYAKRLDTGWSNQAPRGMSDPTLDYLKRHKRRLLRK